MKYRINFKVKKLQKKYRLGKITALQLTEGGLNLASLTLNLAWLLTQHRTQQENKQERTNLTLSNSSERMRTIILLKI